MPKDWTGRVWREWRAGNLTRAYRDVLLTLRTYRGNGGLICPSHESLAKRVGCSIRTVQRALQMGRLLGLISWTERRVRVSWRWLRTSNAYSLELPETPIRRGLRPAWPRRATTGQSDRGGDKESKKEQKNAYKQRTSAALAAMMQAASKLPDLLAARRAAIETRLRRGLA